MTLPGSITIGYLEEDTPQKAFFRIKPLFVKENSGFEHVENAREQFPDEGGIRIVPDKNESNRFKARMRTLGRYCMVDLTRHPAENDKIRPNKNYSPDRQEYNRTIIYSDIVAKCPDDWMSEVVRVDKIDGETIRACLLRHPGTKHMVIACEGRLTGPWLYAAESNENEYSFHMDPAYEAFSVDEKEYQRLFVVPLSEGDTTEAIVTADGTPLFARAAAEVPAAPVAEAPSPAPEVPAAPAAEVPAAPAAEAPAAPAPVAPAPAAAASVIPAPAPVVPASAPVAPAPAPVAPAPAPVAPAPAPVAPAKPAPARPVAAASAPAKSAPVPPAPPAPARDAAVRLSARQAVIAPIPLNPRHKRTLAEVIDDGWRKSRIDQLGSPIPGNAGGQPVISPVEQAEESLQAAWALPEARGTLLDGMLKLEGFSETMAARFGNGAQEPATGAQIETLNSLEEKRLRLLSEIDEMKRQRLDARAKLMDEAREAHAAQVKKMEEEIRRLTAECTARLRAAEDARAAQTQARKALTDETELAKFAMQSRAASLIREWGDVDESDFAASPETYAPNGAQLVSDVRKAFETCGRPLDNDEAVNLLACLAISPITVLSGPIGCGKTSLACLMATALGLTTPGARRFIKLTSAPRPAAEEALYKALTRYEDGRTLRMVLLDDANSHPHGDMTRGLITLNEEKRGESSLRTVLTVLDDQIGYPLNPRVLDRAFLVRLPMPEVTSWDSDEKEMPAPARAASLDAIREIFKGDGDIPGDVEARLATLLERLSALGIRLSRRTLNDMRAYCAAAIPLMTGSPKKALDYAVAQRALPAILASAPLPVLRKLPEILCDLPISMALLNAPLALPPM